MTFNPVTSHGNGYPLGLTGAVSPTRYVGANASGAPASGTFAVGDYTVNADATIYVCTVAGTPGTWTQAGAGAGIVVSVAAADASIVIAGTAADPTVGTQGVLWNPYRSAGKAETIPRGYIGTATAQLSTGRLYLAPISLPKGLLCTSIGWYCSTIAVVAATNQIFGLYDDDSGSSSGTARALLRATSDDTSTAWGTATVKTLNLTSTYTTTRSGSFYLGILVAAATVPALGGCLANTNAVVLDLSPVLCGWPAASGLTALPDPAGAITTSRQLCWGYIA